MENTSEQNAGTKHSIHNAVAHFIQQLQLARLQGDRLIEAHLLLQLGRGYDELGDVDAAIASCEQSLVLAQSSGDRFIESVALAALGSAYAHLGYAQRARTCAEESLRLASTLLNRHAEASALEVLADSSFYLDEWSRASALYATGQQILQKAGDQRSGGRLVEKIGLVYLNQQDFDGDKHVGEQGKASAWPSTVFQSSIEHSIEYFEQSLQMVHEADAPYSKGRILAHLAIAYTQLDRLQQAETLLNQAGDLINALSLVRGEALLAHYRATLRQRQKRFDEARQHYQRALSLYDTLQDRYALARCTFAYAQCLREQGNEQAALRMAHSALHIYKERGTPAQAARVRQWMEDQ